MRAAVQSVIRKIIGAEDFCLFVKNHGRAVIGNRLSYEGLAFVRDYVSSTTCGFAIRCEAPMRRRRSQRKPTKQPSLTVMDVTEMNGTDT